MNRPQSHFIESIGPPVVVVALLSLWVVTRFFSSDPTDQAKEHSSSQRGGQLISLAGNRYHLDLVVEEEKLLRLYTLGADPSQVLEVDQQDLTAYLQADEQFGSTAVTLKPTPQPGDRPGWTSCFTGTLPPGMGTARLSATIPNLRINGNRYHAAFAPADQELEMPAGASEQEAEELYLVPAGKYTAADIQRNAGLTAARKYPRFQAKHDPNPKPGDPRCPITQTKADRNCTWVINGQVYQFCCPPCIDEYVRLAKEQPHRLQNPEAFRQIQETPQID